MCIRDSSHPASFRSCLTADTLAFGYLLPATGRIRVFLPVAYTHLHIAGLQKFVVENGLDAGFAYDGDADRCLAVDEKGGVITGDHILYIYGRYMNCLLYTSRGTGSCR